MLQSKIGQGLQKSMNTASSPKDPLPVLFLFWFFAHA
jgi:hypothetical protein